MAIFSRRTIQRLINENSTFLSSAQTKKHVNKLNLREHINKFNEVDNINDAIRDYLNTEWEVVLLNVFNKFGTVIHEPKLEKSTKEIDILFSSTMHNFEFLGDITCITGKQDKDNVLAAFISELEKIIYHNGLIGSWRIYPGKNYRNVRFRKYAPKIKLVGKKQFDSEIFNTSEFCKFIEGIKGFPEKEHYYNQVTESESIQSQKLNGKTSYEDELINLAVDYKPSKYQQIYTPQYEDRKIINIYENDIYRSLKRKHDKQLSQAGYEGHLGIILCEGISNAFNDGDLIYQNYGNVINTFLYNHPQINFVLTITSSKKFDIYDNGKTFIKVGFYENESNTLKSNAIKMLTKDLVREFPKPARTVDEARRVLRNTFEKKETVFSVDYCGIYISNNEVKISAKTMLELLAGKLSWDSVSYHLGFKSVTGHSFPNMFLKWLNEGKGLNSVRIEKYDFEIDDDWLVFKFSDP